MSSGAAGYSLSPSSSDWRHSPYDPKHKPPPYRQKPVFEGSYIEDDDDLESLRNLDPSDTEDSIEGGTSNPAYQNPEYPQPPQDPADRERPQHQPPSQYTNPYQPDTGNYGPPPNYKAQHDYPNANLRYDAYAPQEKMQAIGQQPSYPDPTVHDPRSVVITYPPPSTGKYVVTQPQGFGGQPPVIILHPILDYPPPDHMSYSIFVSVCCCWFIGFFAIAKSIECRKAIAVGDRGLAKERSVSTRNTAHVALALGILMYVIVGVVIGVRVAAVAGKL